MPVPSRLRLLGAAALLAAFACQNREVEPADAGPSEPSPNASILPAPLASGLEVGQLTPIDAGARDAESDAGPPAPEWAREDQALPADRFQVVDPSLISLSARFRWLDVALPPRLPEANADAIGQARSRTSFELTIEMSALGRMRFVLASPHFLLPEGTALAARGDYLGHALVWPDQRRYAVIQAGAMRAVLNERRADAQPLSRAKAASLDSGSMLGFTTEKSRFTSPFGRLDLEQARIVAAGSGGVLLCRLLLELASLDPLAPTCSPDVLPVRAEYTWVGGGRLLFEVTALARSAGASTAPLYVPPREAEHRIGELPEPPSPHLLERSALRAFRSKPVPPAEPRDKNAPREGLLAVNGGELSRYLLIDGVPVVRLRPRGGDVLLDLLPGTYSVAARDFLSDEVNPAAVVTVPGRVVVSESPKSED